MSNQSNSKCQLFQLHIDAYLDGDLESARTSELEAHLEQCEHCNAEVRYAQQLHAAVIDLPILNCSDAALEPIDRLFEQGVTSNTDASETKGHWLRDMINSIPGFVRYGAPATLVLLVGLGLGSGYLQPENSVEIAGVDPANVQEVPRYSEDEIIQALQDLEVALDYLGQMSQRTNVMIEDRFVRRQLEDSIRASFRDQDIETPDTSNPNGPI